MTLALHVPVTRRIGEHRRRYAQHAIVEDIQDVDAREAAARVARAGVLDRAQDRAAVVHGFHRELVVSRHCETWFGWRRGALAALRGRTRRGRRVPTRATP